MKKITFQVLYSELHKVLLSVIVSTMHSVEICKHLHIKLHLRSPFRNLCFAGEIKKDAIDYLEEGMSTNTTICIDAKYVLLIIRIISCIVYALEIKLQ